MGNACPLCDGSRSGFVIQFPDETVKLMTERAIGSADSHRIHSLGSREIWLEDKLLYAQSMYWQEFFTPSDWGFHTATILPSREVVPSQALTWPQVLETQPDWWIRELIADRRLRMMYQPIVRVTEAGPDIIGYEMLARGFDTDGSVISPLKMYDAAREQNQLFQLDKTCRIEAIWAGGRLPKDSLIFINFIPTSIYVPEHCLQTTLKAATEAGIDRNNVVFEVVETERVDDLAHLKRILQFYRSQGFKYALDDVGKGFNDVPMLKSLEPDVVKLDRAYVSSIHLDAEKRQVAAEVLQACREIGATALAEGVESEDEARLLADMGYTWQQGYYYGRPDWDPKGELRLAQ